ncbi:MAG: BamA/TamA family outer membrane protein [Acidobacteria bacterium]|nr:BamA/TamA family outer membrane protein [Acidobacteriota bacterium]MDA1235963.1 BamA/TamA family outer membrane protein [Acidobacteriota bacterium]
MLQKIVVSLVLIAASAAPSMLLAEADPDKTIREIRINGLLNTHEQLVRDQLTSATGQPFDEELIEQDRERLDRLAVFSRIEMAPTFEGDEVILDINVVETARFIPFPAFSFVEENGVSIGAGVKASSLLGRAISASLDIRVGGQQELEFLLDSPWGMRDKTWYGGEIHARSRINELDDFKEKAIEGEIRGGFQFGPSLRLGGRLEFLTVNADLPEVTLTGRSTESTPGIGMVAAYDTRDLWSNPSRGWENSFSLTRFGGLLGGAGDFTKAVVDLRRYQPLADKHTLTFFSFSTFQTGTVGIDIPIYRDLHLGGTNSVRGWSDLNAREGKNQFINTVEYRYDLFKPKPFRVFGANMYGGLKLAVFGDIGTVWNDGDQFSDNFIGGVGIGLRVIIPFIQMIRLDLAYGQRGEGIVPHFGIREKAFYHRRRVR